ncbi:properdin-like [Xenentodon cancila]
MGDGTEMSCDIIKRTSERLNSLLSFSEGLSPESNLQNCVRCFASFDLDSGHCDSELGEVDEDNCCQNPQHGYQEADGTCQSCGPPVWSPWSSWGSCNILCGDGVRQRHRKCYGIGQSECENLRDRLQTEPCNGTCCNDKGWSLWLAWSPCSVTCGGIGVRNRQRVCSSPPECSAACSGPSEETERCESSNACPVHGSWSRWSDWSQCSGTCIDDQRSNVVVPSRTRQRSCSNPAPSTDTVPPGNSCPGEAVLEQDCSELPNCPVNGNWGAWSSPGPCSVPCGEGLQLSIRKCDSPAPKYGGRICEGSSSQSSVCQSPCPVDGFWSGWSPWSQCSSTCIPESRAAIRTRQRFCNNPVPSRAPPGRACQGEDKQMENCQHLPHCPGVSNEAMTTPRCPQRETNDSHESTGQCQSFPSAHLSLRCYSLCFNKVCVSLLLWVPVDGSWGSWSQFTPCPVTCGVGLQESVRACNSPPPKHGGHPCPGEERRTVICLTNVHCPVHGAWSEWSQWSNCKYPFGNKEIRCQQIGGKQTRNRVCLHQAHNGSVCPEDRLTDTRVCYNVDNCYNLKGRWEGWGSWSLCEPACGEKSRRFRRRTCTPDYSAYRPTIGRQNEVATFSGTPKPDCGEVPDGGKKHEFQLCVNVPQCT